MEYCRRQERIIRVLDNPSSRYEHFRMRVVSHGKIFLSKVRFITFWLSTLL